MNRTVELVAHQGGWDEALLVALPLLIVALLLRLANKRATAQLAERTQPADHVTPD